MAPGMERVLELAQAVGALSEEPLAEQLSRTLDLLSDRELMRRGAHTDMPHAQYN